MKKKKLAVILTALTVGLSGAMTADAMLSEEEQRAAYIESAVREALDAQTEEETEEETEAVTETEGTSETESETETVTEAGTEEQRESEAAEETETGSEMEEPIIVAIDAAHQSSGADLTEEEPVGPGAEKMVHGCSEGTNGTASGMAEAQLNLEVAKKLKEQLETRGYEVYMTRETAEADASEAQRAKLVNESGAQILISLHANGGEDSSERGVSVQAPSYENPYMTDRELIKKSNALADIILQSYCEETGLTAKGLYNVDSRAQMNWSEIPVVVLEMGFMSNAEEDTYMAQETNQQKMAEGIADGIDLYFGRS